MRYSINHDKSSFFEAPAVYVVTSGAGTLKILGKDYSKDIKKGDTFFAPYILNNKLYVESNESVEVVSCLPPV